MRRALFVPLPEPGHIFPTLSLAEYLIATGWEVLYFTAPQFRNQIENIAGSLVPIVNEVAGSGEYSAQHIWSQFVFDTEQGSRSRKLSKSIGCVIAEHKCSLILLDKKLFTGIGHDIREAMDSRKCILLATSLPNWAESEVECPDIPTLVFCPEEFEIPKFRRSLQQFHYVEPSLWPSSNGEELERQLDVTRPIVLVAFGTQSIRDKHLREKLRMISDLAKRRPEFEFVLTTQGFSDSAALNAMNSPPNLQLHKTVPQRRILQKAKTFINHGGLGGIKESIMAGVPMIVLPALFDQPYNAMRVRYHGLGEAVFPEKQNVDVLEAALLATTGGHYQENVLRMRDIFSAKETAKPSHQIIEAEFNVPHL